MKRVFNLILILHVLASCQQKAVDKEVFKNEIFQTEKAFEAMCAEKSVEEAFSYFADEDGVIRRDSVIQGKENIKLYYEKNRSEATVHWTPDFVDVSDDGTLGYTYGKYVWKVKNEAGDSMELKGIFHTVWKRQADGTWRYVWD